MKNVKTSHDEGFVGTVIDRVKVLLVILLSGGVLVFAGSFAVTTAEKHSARALVNERPEKSTELTSEGNVVAADLIATVLDPLNALVNPSEGGKVPSGNGSEYGFAGIVAHPAEKSIDVYWVGDIEPRAQEILDNAPAELTIVVHSARYRLVEMLDAVDRVVGLEFTASDSRDFRVLSAGPEADGSGIWIEYQGEADEQSVARIGSRIAHMTVTSAIVEEPIQGLVGKKP